MTSREALELIKKNFIEPELSGTDNINNLFSYIKKDLEVLEIIKKYWNIEMNNLQVSISYKETSPMGLLPIEETKILEEWLGNETLY